VRCHKPPVGTELCVGPGPGHPVVLSTTLEVEIFQKTSTSWFFSSDPKLLLIINENHGKMSITVVEIAALNVFKTFLPTL